MVKKKCFVAAMFVFALAGCDQAKDGASDTASHNAQNSLDWMGEYTGIQPCGDCSGIETSLTLNKNGTFILNETYQGKETKPFVNEGKFKWNDRGDTITLNLTSKKSVKYFVGEHRIFRLDQKGQRITGDLADAYTLKQNDDN
ncbi:copper resistance protein NlpE [uncultured Photobacterium sp.]|uniref:copper resistance protein NlpE n=1 Tax=uncultured Photobacterium sp. TaxID=173973 RepID=UPI00260FF1F5|nr:copper resistance protein NlpE [uncultured Photobacterium sp.]